MTKFNLIRRKIGKYAIILFVLAAGISIAKEYIPQVQVQTAIAEAPGGQLEDSSDQKKLELYAEKLRVERKRKDLQNQLKEVEKELEALRAEEVSLYQAPEQSR